MYALLYTAPRPPYSCRPARVSFRSDGPETRWRRGCARGRFSTGPGDRERVRRKAKRRETASRIGLGKGGGDGRGKKRVSNGRRRNGPRNVLCVLRAILRYGVTRVRARRHHLTTTSIRPRPPPPPDRDRIPSTSLPPGFAWRSGRRGDTVVC